MTGAVDNLTPWANERREDVLETLVPGGTGRRSSGPSQTEIQQQRREEAQQEREQEREARSEAQRERAVIARRRGRASTVLTSPAASGLGLGRSSVGTRQLLGN